VTGTVISKALFICSAAYSVVGLIKTMACMQFADICCEFSAQKRTDKTGRHTLIQAQTGTDKQERTDRHEQPERDKQGWAGRNR